MKSRRFGQSAILSHDDERLLFNALKPRYRLLFGICLYTGCRIGEALQLRRDDISEEIITIRRETTKGQRGTRQIPIAMPLRGILSEGSLGSYWVNESRRTHRPITRQAADHALRVTSCRIGLVGISTHTFRRTALTRMSAAGIPLRTIQSISGHQSLDALQRYLEVSPQDRIIAISKI
jgi:integrase/recombinase XerD